MKIEFKVIAGPLKGKNFYFDKFQTISIGRSKQNFFSFPDDHRISRVHALIELAPPYNCFIKDLNSRNGTYHGKIAAGTKKVKFNNITEAHIQNGDCLRVGRTTLRIFFSEPQQKIKCHKCGTTIKPEQYAQKDASSFDGKSYCKSCHKQIEPHAGKQIGNFTIIRKLGAGAMGVVYLVRHSKGHKFALKIANPGTLTLESVQIQRFLREAEYGSKIKHKNIVRYYPAQHASEGFFYIPMEYVPGMDLKEYIEKNGPMPLEQAKKAIGQILDALVYLHNQNIIHRDIKPANILLLEEESNLIIKISDFGIAKNYEEAGLNGLTLSSRAMGTPDYLPPEQLLSAKKVDYRADIYSTGATIYHLLTGLKLYKGVNSHNIYYKILEEDPTPIQQLSDQIPIALGNCIMKCLAKKPEDRYDSIEQLKQQMQLA